MSSTGLPTADLYASERGRLARLIQRIVRNRAATDDLVHDSFVRLLDRLGAGAGIADREAYLTRIAHNLAIDHKRREREHVGLDEAGLFEMADSRPDAETSLAGRQALARTFLILAAMPERTRRAFEMHRLGESTLTEIGVTLGISTAHAGRLVMEGYRALRDGLRDAGFD